MSKCIGVGVGLLSIGFDNKGEGGGIGIEVGGELYNVCKILDEIQEVMDAAKETELELRRLGECSRWEGNKVAVTQN